MALSVKIQAPNSGTEYSLQCEVVEHTVNRSPSAAPLPGDPSEEAGDPEVFYLDLGMQLEQVTLSGVLDDTDSPTKANLRTAATTLWKENVSGTPAYVKLTEPDGEVFYGGFKQVSVRKDSTESEYWRFTIVFIVKYKGS